jgi:hypothetical protein
MHPAFSNPPSLTWRSRYTCDVPILALWQFNKVLFALSLTLRLDLSKCLLSGDTKPWLCSSTIEYIRYFLSLSSLTRICAWQPHLVSITFCDFRFFSGLITNFFLRSPIYTLPLNNNIAWIIFHHFPSCAAQHEQRNQHCVHTICKSFPHLREYQRSFQP